MSTTRFGTQLLLMQITLVSTMQMTCFFDAAPEEGKPPVLEVKQSQLKTKETLLKASVNAGDELTVRLEYIANGYAWRLKSSSKNLIQIGDKPVSERTGKSPGDPEYLVYKFKTKGIGKLSFELARPFGANPESKLVEIDVTESEKSRSP